MLNYEEKKKIADILRELNINPDLNFAYFLDEIDETNEKVKSIESRLQQIIYNQKNIEKKLDLIIRKIG